MDSMEQEWREKFIELITNSIQTMNLKKLSKVYSAIKYIEDNDNERAI